MTYHDKELQRLKKKVYLRDHPKNPDVFVAVNNEEKTVILFTGSASLHLTPNGARQMSCALGEAADLVDPPRAHPIPPKFKPDGASE